MKLSQMQALANSKTGLVAMTIKRAFAPWRVGDVAGFPPETALAHFDEGVATIYGYDAPGEFRPMAAAPEVEFDPLDRDRNGSRGGSLKQPKAPKAPPEIPADWEKSHSLKRIRLATDLGWKKPAKETMAEGVKVSDLADEFLRAEVAKKWSGEPAAAPAAEVPAG